MEASWSPTFIYAHCGLCWLFFGIALPDCKILWYHLHCKCCLPHLANQECSFQLCHSSCQFCYPEARSHTDEILISTVMSSKTWGFCIASRAPCGVFVSWEPPPDYVTVNFDESVLGTHGGASFVIRGLTLGVIAVGGQHLIEPMVPSAELRGA